MAFDVPPPPATGGPPPAADGGVPYASTGTSRSATTPGLATYPAGWSHVPRTDGGAARPPGPQGPTIAVRDLHDKQPGKVPDGLGEKPEHPKLNGAPGATNVSFWAGTHFQATHDAAIRAGLDEDTANGLAAMVVAVDNEEGSQGTKNAVWHAMRSEGQTPAEYKKAAAKYVREMLGLKSAKGIARLLHMMQDSYSPSHNGPDGPEVWHGLWKEILSLNIEHVIGDRPPPDAVKSRMVKVGAALIKAYMAYAKQSIHIPRLHIEPTTSSSGSSMNSS